jgi:DNA repair protein RecO (recombination protein O)
VKQWYCKAGKAMHDNLKSQISMSTSHHHHHHIASANFNLTSAFVLHSRPYRETSALITFFTDFHGKVTAVVRGVRKARSPIAGLLTPFFELLVALRGKGELLNLQMVENAGVSGASLGLRGNALFAGLYVNELLARLLHYHDPHPRLFQYYRSMLTQLQECAASEFALCSALRIFEKNLLQEVGYGLQLHRTVMDEVVDAACYYSYQVGAGLMPYSDDSGQGASSSVSGNGYQGRDLLALHHERLENERELQVATKIINRALYAVLGDKFWQCRKVLDLAVVTGFET